MRAAVGGKVNAVALAAGRAEAGVRYAFRLAVLEQGVYLARLITDAGQQTVRLALVR